MFPGTEAYVPLDAVQDKPAYTEKIDCSLFGIITLQIFSTPIPQTWKSSKINPINHPEML